MCSLYDIFKMYNIDHYYLTDKDRSLRRLNSNKYNRWQFSCFKCSPFIIQVVRELLNLSSRFLFPELYKKICSLHRKIWTSFGFLITDIIGCFPAFKPISCYTIYIMELENSVRVSSNFISRLKKKYVSHNYRTYLLFLNSTTRKPSIMSTI